jgi:hypothetical protein
MGCSNSLIGGGGGKREGGMGGTYVGGGGAWKVCGKDGTTHKTTVTFSALNVHATNSLLWLFTTATFHPCDVLLLQHFDRYVLLLRHFISVTCYCMFLLPRHVTVLGHPLFLPLVWQTVSFAVKQYVDVLSHVSWAYLEVFWFSRREFGKMSQCSNNLSIGWLTDCFACIFPGMIIGFGIRCWCTICLLKKQGPRWNRFMRNLYYKFSCNCDLKDRFDVSYPSVWNTGILIIMPFLSSSLKPFENVITPALLEPSIESL